jgi:hypothetical protein
VAQRTAEPSARYGVAGGWCKAIAGGRLFARAGLLHRDQDRSGPVPHHRDTAGDLGDPEQPEPISRERRYLDAGDPAAERAGTVDLLGVETERDVWCKADGTKEDFIFTDLLLNSLAIPLAETSHQ